MRRIDASANPDPFWGGIQFVHCFFFWFFVFFNLAEFEDPWTERTCLGSRFEAGKQPFGRGPGFDPELPGNIQMVGPHPHGRMSTPMFLAKTTAPLPGF